MDKFEALASQYQYSEDRDRQGEELRKRFISKFPAEKLPTLTLQEYALGLEPKENSFCYWLEFETETLGRIGGAPSSKHIIFFSKKKNKWQYDSKFPNENVAFEQVRKGLVALVQLAAEEKYEQLESVEPFNKQNLTRGKILFLYHPDKFLPTYSLGHLKALCLQLGISANFNSQIAMNRALLRFKEAHPETKSWSNLKFTRFLYEKYPPMTQFWKVAPGEKARYWDDCTKNGIICMGFDEMGDVREYEDEDDFKSEFRKHYPTQPPAKWRELWNFANEISDKDVVVANRGITSIVGTGKIDGDYYFDSTQPEFKHCLKVNWEDTQERAIPTDAAEIVKDWSFNTVKKIGREDFQKLSKGAPITNHLQQELQQSLKSVLSLQGQWSADNTQPMQERGELVRNRIPGLLELTSQSYGLEVEGSDGIGKKTRVPWVRLYDARLSPSAMQGWYVVFLFAADGSAVFLSLNQGTTKIVRGSSVVIDPDILQERVKEARAKVENLGINRSGLSQTMDLKDPGNKGGAYELGNVYAIKYDASQIPDDAKILADASKLVKLLKVLYGSDSTADISRSAYLLAWNPENWNWDNLPRLAMLFRSGRQIIAEGDDATWKVANKAIKPGDRLYLIRLAKEPKGIMGSGLSESVPYHDAHYSGEPGKTADYVKLRWDALLDPLHDKILPLAEVEKNIPEVHWTTQSSGILISPDGHSKLEKMWTKHLASYLSQPYTMNDALEDVFLEPELFREIYELARRKKNIVLQGPPGVGKTFVAERLAYALLGAKDKRRLEWVQFHQSYSYEDFIMGFRPNGTGFELKSGIFYRFCDQARKNPDQTHVFVIDEINRGNLSRIFGEALSLIEEDKREKLAATLAYGTPNHGMASQTDESKEWTIPGNLILLGLMNTADRSLAVVDYALRRRFVFVDLLPQFDSPKFEAVLAAKGISSGTRENIKNRVKALNSRICGDTQNLGRGFEIGHSFFCPKDIVPDEEQWLRSVIKYEIKPLLAEYWFDQQAKAESEVRRLLGENPD